MIATAIALALANAPIDQEPPPFLQFMEEGEALGRAIHLGAVCAGLKIVDIDQGKLSEIVDDFFRRAVIAKVDGPFINGAVKQGMERERAATKLMLDLGPNDGSETSLRREEQAVEYFGDGCADLTLDYPEAFRLK